MRHRLGSARRSGVVMPLFSVYSSRSIGIGEIPDLKLAIDWCASSDLSILALLPMNEVGSGFSPYDAQSSLAMDPMYLSLEGLKAAPTPLFQQSIDQLRKRFPAGTARVRYEVKAAKVSLLRQIFRKLSRTQKNSSAFAHFKIAQNHWLEDYVLFRFLADRYGASWERWPEAFRDRKPKALTVLAKKYSAELEFYRWLQWQLYESFVALKHYAKTKGVLIMGDLPFLISRESADVWAHQELFKLDRSSGAPPDMYMALGQRWGMPPYRWEKIEQSGYAMLKSKLKYAAHFYDLFRIDHCVGTFRLWTISTHEPVSTGGLYGSFDPANDRLWKAHGRRILEVMSRTSMLPCAEDLGTVPRCSDVVLKEMGIPGTNVQRWTKDEYAGYEFLPPRDYRPNSMCVLSTHDSASFKGWWNHEAGTVDAILIRQILGQMKLPVRRILPKLFDLRHSHHGRLRWKDSVNSAGKLKSILASPDPRVGKLIHLHETSFGEKQKFWRFLGFKSPCDPRWSKKILQKALEQASRSKSIFNLQLLQDWLSLSDVLGREDDWRFRINFPGTCKKENWSLVMPISLEELNTMKDLQKEIRRINRLRKSSAF